MVFYLVISIAVFKINYFNFVIFSRDIKYILSLFIKNSSFRSHSIDSKRFYGALSGIRFYSSSSNKTIYKDSESITSDVLNSLLENQQVSITEEELNNLKKICGVRFDLPLDDITYPSFESLVGKPNTRNPKTGIYIFTHKESGSKYVGSSNSLSRRLNQYFTFKHFNQENSGLIIPLFKKEGFEAFNLSIFVMPNNLNVSPVKSDYSYLFLEQYYLLHEEFNLNTQRIVNFRINQGKNIYLYDLEGKILYYSSNSLKKFMDVLRTHHETCTNCIKTGESYLDYFKITDTPISDAIQSDLTLPELLELLENKRKETLKKQSKIKFSKAIMLRKEDEEEIIKFNSITETVRYFENLGLKVDRNKISKALDTNKPYKGYVFFKSK